MNNIFFNKGIIILKNINYYEKLYISNNFDKYDINKKKEIIESKKFYYKKMGLSYGKVGGA